MCTMPFMRTICSMPRPMIVRLRSSRPSSGLACCGASALLQRPSLKMVLSKRRSIRFRWFQRSYCWWLWSHRSGLTNPQVVRRFIKSVLFTCSLMLGLGLSGLISVGRVWSTPISVGWSHCLCGGAGESRSTYRCAARCGGSSASFVARLICIWIALSSSFVLCPSWRTCRTRVSFCLLPCLCKCSSRADVAVCALLLRSAAVLLFLDAPFLAPLGTRSWAAACTVAPLWASLILRQGSLWRCCLPCLPAPKGSPHSTAKSLVDRFEHRQYSSAVG